MSPTCAWEEDLIVLMERDCEDGRRVVECLFYTISVMNVHVNIKNSLHSATLER